MDENSRKIYEKYGIDADQYEQELQKNINEKIKETNQINSEYFSKIFEEGMNERFPELSHYLHHPILVFTELEPKIREIISCLIMGAYSASITLTNHVLERLLKLALIIDTVGLERVKIDDWNSVYSEVDNINSESMHNTVSMCKKRNLICEEEKVQLDYFRENIRNGFSHSDPKQIFKNEKDTKILFFNAKNPEDNKSIELNFKSIPMLQSAYTNQFAEENAEYFFEVVFELMYNIQKRIRSKYYKL